MRCDRLHAKLMWSLCIVGILSLLTACGGADSDSPDPDETRDAATSGDDVSELEDTRDTKSSDTGQDVESPDGTVDAGQPEDAAENGDTDAGQVPEDANSETPQYPPRAKKFAYDFAKVNPDDSHAPTKEGWVAGISDYSAEQKETIAFESGLKEHPNPDEMSDRPPSRAPHPERWGFYLESKNVSDDAFMFLKRQIGRDVSLKSNTAYTLHWSISFLSNAPSNCAGIGGPPGEAVYMKAGGSPKEPVVNREDGGYKINIDKGNQSSGGQHAGVVGTIQNSIPCEEAQGSYPYKKVEHTYSHETAIETDESGNMWLIVGTDSGFEGTTGLYYLQLEVSVVEQDGKYERCRDHAGSTCASYEYCNFPTNSCGNDGGFGYCRAVPGEADCPPASEADPVCGCDGQTYESQCLATSSNVDIAHRGPCENDDS